MLRMRGAPPGRSERTADGRLARSGGWRFAQHGVPRATGRRKGAQSATFHCGGEPERTHDLTQLLLGIATRDPALGRRLLLTNRNAVAILTPFAVTRRYPGETDASGEQAASALATADASLAAVLERSGATPHTLPTTDVGGCIGRMGLHRLGTPSRPDHPLHCPPPTPRRVTAPRAVTPPQPTPAGSADTAGTPQPPPPPPCESPAGGRP